VYENDNEIRDSISTCKLHETQAASDDEFVTLTMSTWTTSPLIHYQRNVKQKHTKYKQTYKWTAINLCTVK